MSEALEPGIYFQDILTDGTRSALRQNFPTVNRNSFDTRPPVAETLQIAVSVIYSRPKPPEVVQRDIVRHRSIPLVLTPPEETPPEVMHEAEELFRMPKQ